MLKIYCSDCGSPTNYTANKPKFCSNCGNLFEKNLNIQKQVLKKAPVKQVENDIEDEYDDDDTDASAVPNINKLDCEILDVFNKKEKIGDILGTLESSSRIKEKTQGNKNLSKLDRKKFLDDFSKEAGALKPKTRTRKNGK